MTFDLHFTYGHCCCWCFYVPIDTINESVIDRYYGHVTVVRPMCVICSCVHADDGDDS